MRISDYIRQLNKIDDSELDQFIGEGSGRRSVFTRVIAPPTQWGHALGSVSNAPGGTTEISSRERVKIGRTGLLSAKLFLPGFMKDMKLAYGSRITEACIDAHCPNKARPITARAVKAVIAQAELMRKAELTALLSDYPEKYHVTDKGPSVDTAKTLSIVQEKNISLFLDHPMWAGTLFAGVAQPEEIHLAVPAAFGVLDEGTAKIFKDMLASVCNQSCDPIHAPLTKAKFVEIANIFLDRYNQIRHEERITPLALGVTFVLFDEDLRTRGPDMAMSALPVHAATACLICNLDPANPDSLISEAIQRAKTEFPLTKLSDMALARIHESLLNIFEHGQFLKASMNLPLQENAFTNTIKLGTQFIADKLEETLQTQTLIEASPTLVPRQKLLMLQWFEEGTEDKEGIERYTQAAERMTDSLEEFSLETDTSLHSEMAEKLTVAIPYIPDDNPAFHGMLIDGTYIRLNLFFALQKPDLILTKPDGTSFVNMEGWSALVDSEKLKRIAIAQREIRDALFNGDESLTYSFLARITALDSSLASLIQKDPKLNTTRLPDGTPVHRFSGSRPKIELKITGTENGLLQFTYQYHHSNIRSAVDLKYHPLWLEPKSSHHHYECNFATTSYGRFYLTKPIRQWSELTPTDWPNKSYPEPVRGDITQAELFEHLSLYAKSSGNVDGLNVLRAFEGLSILGARPTAEREQAFYREHIASGALNCLGDIAKASIVAPLSRHLLFDEVIVFLNAAEKALTPLADNQASWGAPEIAELNKAAQALIKTPERDTVLVLYNEIYVKKGPLFQAVSSLPPELAGALEQTMSKALRPVDASIIDALRNEMIDYIEREILPAFIESVRSEPAAEENSDLEF